LGGKRRLEIAKISLEGWLKPDSRLQATILALWSCTSRWRAS
jgi:hypothetical protein